MSSENESKSSDQKAPASKKRLGKGLGALLGETRREEPLVLAARSGGQATTREATDSSGQSAAAQGLQSLSIASIDPNPDQPRSHFDDDAIAELAESIAARGVIQPIIVRPTRVGRY